MARNPIQYGGKACVQTTSYPGFSLCGRGLKRTLAKAAEYYVICCIFPGGFLNYQEEPVRRLLFCLFIEIAHSVDRYRNIYGMKCAQLYKINEDYRELCSYEMLLNDNISNFVCLRIVLN